MARDDRTFVDVLRRHAETHPDRPALIFLPDGEKEGTRWTYGDLDRRARATAAELSAVAQPGDRVLLLVPASADFVSAFFGCLYAGMLAIPAYPPRNRRHMPRVEAILRDTDARVMLTASGVVGQVREWLGSDGTGGCHVMSADLVDDASAAAWRAPHLAPDGLAFLQYTSGSVGDPKGVEVTHGNLLANQRMIQRRFDHGERSNFVSWLPLFHDMGLVGNLMQPLFVGAFAALMPPTVFVERPARWFHAITRYRPHTTGAPNFAYALSLRSIPPEERATFDLSSLRNLYVGAEPIDAAIVTRFIETFADCGLRPEAVLPCYGMAETTLLSTCGGPHLRPVFLPQPPSRTLVGCGGWDDDQSLLVVDPETRQPLNDGAVGEVWIRGPHVARGYWRRPAETAETFGAQLATGDGPFLRTGDLGVVHEGELFVTGRIKDILIIRGANVYPSDIERTVAASHPDLQPDAGVVFGMPAGSEEGVVIVQEVRRQALRRLDGHAIGEAIRRAVFDEHELTVHGIVLVKPMTVPKTSSGKVQRRACRASYAAGTLPQVWSWSKEDASPDAASRGRADDVITWLRWYGEHRINSRLMDERRTIPPYVVLDFGRRGVLGLQAPLETGGLALTQRDTFRVLEQLAAIDLTLCSFVGVHNVLGVRPIVQFGSDEQRRRLLPDLASGRQLASFAFTEPGAGSNPLAITSTAAPAASGWTLRGSKKWIGTAAWAGYLHVFVRLDDVSGGHDGITAFVVPQGAPGLRQGPEELTMGMRAMVQNTVYLDGVAVGAGDVLGQVGQGLPVAYDIMRHARLAVAAASLGVMKRALQLMTRYASRRAIGTGLLLDNIVTRERLTELTTATSALDAFVYGFASWLDRELPVPDELFAAAKVGGPEESWRAVDQLMQLLGARGYIETNGVPQMLRDARLLRIFEGPSETMLMYVGSRLLAGSAGLADFIRDQLAQDALATALEEVTHDLQQSVSAAASDRSSGDLRQRAAWILGDVGLATVWLAAVVDHRARTTDAEYGDALRWARSRFEEACARARELRPERDQPLRGSDILRIVARYGESIGDVEQQADGELQHIDSMLKRDDVEQRTQATPPVASTPLPPPAVTRGAVKPTTSAALDLERLIQGWIAERLGVDPSRISTGKAFYDFGVDSVTAVEMIGGLGQRLGRSLSPTLVWDFPTIRELAAHLAAAAEPAAVGSASATDEEIAALLAAELESLREKKS